MPNVHRRPFRTAAAATAALLATVTAACSSSAGSAGTPTAPAAGGGTESQVAADPCVRAADTYLKPFTALPTALPAELTPLAATPKAGVSIISLEIASIPGAQEAARAIGTAAGLLHWKFSAISFDGSVGDLNAKFNEAVDKHPDVIQIGAFPVSAIAQPLARAKAAGIVVVLDNVVDEPKDYPGFAAVNNGAEVAKALGKLNANLVMRDSGCTAHVALFTLPFPILAAIGDSFTSELKDKCPRCSVSETQIQTKDLGTAAATTAIVSKLQSDRSVKYAFTIIEALAAGLPTALSQAGISGIKIFGDNPDSTSIKALQDKTNAWWITQSSTLNGWMDVYVASKALETHSPVINPVNVFGVLTPDNVPQGSSGVPIYPADYEKQFSALWHL